MALLEYSLWHYFVRRVSWGVSRDMEIANRVEEIRKVLCAMLRGNLMKADQMPVESLQSIEHVEQKTGENRASLHALDVLRITNPHTHGRTGLQCMIFNLPTLCLQRFQDSQLGVTVDHACSRESVN